jgi:hypothetical protein
MALEIPSLAFANYNYSGSGTATQGPYKIEKIYVDGKNGFEQKFENGTSTQYFPTLSNRVMYGTWVMGTNSGEFAISDAVPKGGKTWRGWYDFEGKYYGLTLTGMAVEGD